MTEQELEEIEERLELVETHEDGYDMLWAISDLIAEIRRLNKQLADAPTVHCYQVRNHQFWELEGVLKHSDPPDATAKLVDIKKIGEGE